MNGRRRDFSFLWGVAYLVFATSDLKWLLGASTVSQYLFFGACGIICGLLGIAYLFRYFGRRW